jgi:diacylglycerol kinase (ATP)
MISAYLSARIRSFGYAISGIITLVRTQPHAWLHLIATGVIIGAGYLVHLRRWEWVTILLCIGMVWTAEAFNTAIEFLADEMSLERRECIGRAKDVAAGAVLISAMISVLIAAMIFKNHLH